MKKIVLFFVRIVGMILFRDEYVNPPRPLKIHLKYCDYSDTIRIMPANYCVLVRRNNIFLPGFDDAISLDIKKKMLKILNRYRSEQNPYFLIEKLNNTLVPINRKLYKYERTVGQTVSVE